MLSGLGKKILYQRHKDASAALLKAITGHSEGLALALQQRVRRMRKQCGPPLGPPLGLGYLLAPTGEGSPGHHGGGQHSFVGASQGGILFITAGT
jgi:hypothetical protein